jgi:hypothetical protein
MTKLQNFKNFKKFQKFQKLLNKSLKLNIHPNEYNIPFRDFQGLFFLVSGAKKVVHGSKNKIPSLELC